MNFLNCYWIVSISRAKALWNDKILLLLWFPWIRFESYCIWFDDMNRKRSSIFCYNSAALKKYLFIFLYLNEIIKISMLQTYVKYTCRNFYVFDFYEIEETIFCYVLIIYLVWLGFTGIMTLIWDSFKKPKSFYKAESLAFLSRLTRCKKK